MILGLLDKLWFAGLFILMLQIPIVADHYRQYLSGYIAATESEIKHYNSLAQDYGYANTEEMLSVLLNNSDPLVRDDTVHKIAVIADFQASVVALRQLNNSHYFQQLWIFLQPYQYSRLAAVLEYYRPSIPLHLPAIGSALASTLTVYLILLIPFLTLRKRQRPAGSSF